MPKVSAIIGKTGDKKKTLNVRGSDDDRDAMRELAATTGLTQSDVVRGFLQSNRKRSREELLPMILGDADLSGAIRLQINGSDSNRLAMLAGSMGYGELESFVADVVRATLSKTPDEVREWMIGRALREMESDTAASTRSKSRKTA